MPPPIRCPGSSGWTPPEPYDDEEYVRGGIMHTEATARYCRESLPEFAKLIDERLNAEPARIATDS